jgi:hypothetical protein
MRVSSVVVAVSVLASVAGCAADVDTSATATVGEALTAADLTWGDYLFAGEQVYSTDCNFRLIMGTDGNLVVYRGGTALWSTGTSGHPGAYATVQPDNNFVVYSPSGSALWATNTVGTGAISLIMQTDGNLVFYNSFNPIWWTGTNQSVLPPNCGIPRASEAQKVSVSYDRPGADLPAMPTVASFPSSCGAQCAARSDCLSWTFVSPNSCFLKNGVPNLQVRPGMVSGRKQRLCNGASSC